MTAPLLELERVTKRFAAAGRAVIALDSLDLSIMTGECHAIVGESGSGKSTLGGIILGLLPPSAGMVRFEGAPLPARRSLALKRAIQLIQQNPLTALNPRRSVGQSIRLALDVHKIGARAERPARVAALLAEVGLPADYARRSPRGLSGGERQRIAIARALACQPRLLVLDEPTSSLDVLVQARVLALLATMRRQHGLTFVFISHDLAVVRGIADRVSVFEKGRLVETGTVDAIFANPSADYTRRLIGAIPVVSDDEARLRDRFRATLPTNDN